jgi:SAM-dependent methyltransferase
VTSRSPNALLASTPAGPVALLDPAGHERSSPLDPLWIALLETLVHHPTEDGEALAGAARDRLGRQGAGHEARLERARQAIADGAVVFVSAGGIRVLVDGMAAHGEVITLTRASRDEGNVLGTLLRVPVPTAVDADRCEQAVSAMSAAGLIVPAPGTVQWGDLRRRLPICEVFGIGRGTPIDRHYLRAFVRSVASQVTGDVVDVGGHPADRLSFGFRDLRSFRVVDLEDRPGVDVVGDAHDVELLPAASVDTVLLFNVLEHCRDPHRVAANVHRWLRGGGRCLVMVPNAQRLHGAPDDLWRFSESGLGQVLADFETVETRSYGSLTTVLASHLGLAAEELSVEELDARQADHPVATCAVAIR